MLYVPISGHWESKGLEQHKRKVEKSSTFKDVVIQTEQVDICGIGSKRT